jgi:NAD-dependent dihydropyrimidine dehydrogenase PreA subunit
MPDMDTTINPSARTRCRQAPGHFVPVIDRNRCEGKGPCTDACPFDVLAMGVLSRSERSGLTVVGRIKAFAHGHRQAFVVAPDACAACGDCVRVCPEHAITLQRVDPSPDAQPAKGRSHP